MKIQTKELIGPAPAQPVHVQNPAEIEHVAGDVSKNGPESNMAQRPAPSAAATEQQAVAFRMPPVPFEKVADGIEVGYDVFGGVDIRLGGDFVYVHINYNYRYTDNATRKCLADQIVGLLTTPQMEAQEPAFWTRKRFGEEREFCEAPFTTDWTPLYTAPQPSPTPQADSQPAHQWDTGYPPLPECDAITVGLGAVWNRHSMRAYVDADRAARTPADSVTAPAGGAAVIPQGWRLVPEVPTQLMVNAAKWNVDGRLSVFKWADGYYAMLAAAPTPPAQAADSVLEDAARLDWLLLHISGAEFRRIGVHYSGNARRADVDAARKQGANHD